MSEYDEREEPPDSRNNEAQQSLVEAEVAHDIEEVVQDEVQRAVQELIRPSHAPLAIVLASETNDESSEENDGHTICCLPRNAFYILLFGLVGATIAGIITAVSKNGEEEPLPVTVAPNTFPTISPSNAPTSMLDVLYPGQAMEDLSPAQLNATRWIVEKDSFEWKTPIELVERHALATLYYFVATTSEESGIPEWLTSSTPHCGWEYVSCNKRGFVVSLDLINKGLSGSLPSEIGRLSNLEELFH